MTHFPVMWMTVIVGYVSFFIFREFTVKSHFDKAMSFVIGIIGENDWLECSGNCSSIGRYCNNIVRKTVMEILN